MALVLNGTPVSGKQALQNALDDFRTLLSDNERFRLDAFARSGKPNTASALLLTTEIDQAQAQRLSRRIAVKVQPFLEHVHRFTSVMDTFAQSNNIASLTWGSIKLTLLLTSNFSGFFAKLTALFVQIGHLCPRYEEYYSLYHSSASLQNALSSYYAVMVTICQQAVKISRRPGIVQLSTSAFCSFEHEFGKLKDKAEAAAEEVNVQVHLATGQVQVEEVRLDQLEREKSEASRKILVRLNSRTEKAFLDISKWQQEQDVRETRKARLELRRILSDFDFRQSFRQAGKQCITDTGVWFRSCKPFQDHLSDADSACLWLSSPMGSGKSVVAANIVTDLYDRCARNPSHSTIAYMFCQAEHRSSLSASTVMGTMALQLLDTTIEELSREEIDVVLAKLRPTDPHSFLELILNYLKGAITCYVIVDGLDFCAESELVTVLDCCRELLSSLPENISLKLTITARPDKQTLIRKALPMAKTMSPSPWEQDHDMSLFVEATLAAKLQSLELQLEDHNLILGIRDYISTGSQGMFLWAYLLLEELCTCNGDNEIIRQLQSVPSKLSDLYFGILSNVFRSGDGFVLTKLLKWTIGAMRPMKTTEIREGLIIELGQKCLPQNATHHNIRGLVFVTHGLLFIDEDEDTVHMVHHSLRQALFDASNAQLSSCSLSPLSPGAVDIELGTLCMTYLLFTDFSHQLIRSNPTQGLTVALNTVGVAQVATQSSPLAGAVTSKALQLLRNSSDRRVTSRTGAGIEQQLRTLAEQMAIARRKNQLGSRSFPFLSYAKANWYEHIKQLSSNDHPCSWMLFLSVEQSTGPHIDRPWINMNTKHTYCLTNPWRLLLSTVGDLGGRVDDFKALRWASLHQHEAMIELKLPPFCEVWRRTGHVQGLVKFLKTTVLSEKHNRAMTATVLRTIRQMKDLESYIVFLVVAMFDLPSFGCPFDHLSPEARISKSALHDIQGHGRVSPIVDLMKTFQYLCTEYNIIADETILRQALNMFGDNDSVGLSRCVMTWLQICVAYNRVNCWNDHFDQLEFDHLRTLELALISGQTLMAKSLARNVVKRWDYAFSPEPQKRHRQLRCSLVNIVLLFLCYGELAEARKVSALNLSGQEGSSPFRSGLAPYVLSIAAKLNEAETFRNVLEWNVYERGSVSAIIKDPNDPLENIPIEQWLWRERHKHPKNTDLHQICNYFRAWFQERIKSRPWLDILFRVQWIAVDFFILRASRTSLSGDYLDSQLETILTMPGTVKEADEDFVSVVQRLSSNSHTLLAAEAMLAKFHQIRGQVCTEQVALSELSIKLLLWTTVYCTPWLRMALVDDASNEKQKGRVFLDIRTVLCALRGADGVAAFDAVSGIDTEQYESIIRKVIAEWRSACEKIRVSAAHWEMHELRRLITNDTFTARSSNRMRCFARVEAIYNDLLCLCSEAVGRRLQELAWSSAEDGEVLPSELLH